MDRITTLIGVARMDASGYILKPRGDIETDDAQFAKTVCRHFNHRVQFYKRKDAKIDSEVLSRIVDRALGCGGAYMKLDTSVDVLSIIERSAQQRQSNLHSSERREARKR